MGHRRRPHVGLPQKARHAACLPPAACSAAACRCRSRRLCRGSSQLPLLAFCLLPVRCKSLQAGRQERGGAGRVGSSGKASERAAVHLTAGIAAALVQLRVASRCWSPPDCPAARKAPQQRRGGKPDRLALLVGSGALAACAMHMHAMPEAAQSAAAAGERIPRAIRRGREAVGLGLLEQTQQLSNRRWAACDGRLGGGECATWQGSRNARKWGPLCPPSLLALVHESKLSSSRRAAGAMSVPPSCSHSQLLEPSSQDLAAVVSGGDAPSVINAIGRLASCVPHRRIRRRRRLLRRS